MKWFKHDAHSLSRAAIEKLIMEHGMEGYGLYYACLEMIAGTIETRNLTFELEHDAKIIAHKFKMDTLKVEQIMHRCIELGLFDLADSGNLRCLRLAIMIDDSTSKNPEFIKLKEFLNSSGVLKLNNSEKFRKIPKRSSQNRIEEKRKEEKKEEVLEPDEPSPCQQSFKDIRALFESKNSTYYHDGKQAKCIKGIMLRCEKTGQAPGEVIERYHSLTTGTDKWWNQQPFTPCGLLGLWDRVMVTEKKKEKYEYF